MKNLTIEEINEVYRQYNVDPNNELKNIKFSNFILPNSFCAKAEMKINTSNTSSAKIK